jgi:hypothetical protein
MLAIIGLAVHIQEQLDTQAQVRDFFFHLFKIAVQKARVFLDTDEAAMRP